MNYVTSHEYKLSYIRSLNIWSDNFVPLLNKMDKFFGPEVVIEGARYYSVEFEGEVLIIFFCAGEDYKTKPWIVYTKNVEGYEVTERLSEFSFNKHKKVDILGLDFIFERD